MSEKNTAVERYKLLITGILEQQTAFSIGGNRPENSPIDMLLGKDGKGRFTIRGTGLAGAFIATARQLYNLEEKISEGTPAEQKQKNEAAGSNKENLPRLKESVWIFHHAHLVKSTEKEIRDGVAISQKTGAALDTAKFDAETLPKGTCWHFLMEVNEYLEGVETTAASIALNTAKQWQKNCWLGRDVARGLGWMKLIGLKVYRLPPEAVALWPNSREEPLTTLKKLEKYVQGKEKQHRVCEEQKPSNSPHTHSGTIVFTVGNEHPQDGYGIDFLSVGGVSKNNEKQFRKIPTGFTGVQFDGGKYLSPAGISNANYIEKKGDAVKAQEKDSHTPDTSLAVTRNQKGEIVPYIPGSSIRGSMRHTLSWILRQREESTPVWEPGGDNGHPKTAEEINMDIVLKMFGSTELSAGLLISDAHPDNDSWQALIQEMHAEDEFTQGVFGKSKFDRSCLIKGHFTAHYHLSADTQNELDNMRDELRKLNTLAQQNMIPLGGGQWKGLGWIKWEIN